MTAPDSDETSQTIALHGGSGYSTWRSASWSEAGSDSQLQLGELRISTEFEVGSSGCDAHLIRPSTCSCNVDVEGDKSTVREGDRWRTVLIGDNNLCTVSTHLALVHYAPMLDALTSFAYLLLL